MEILIPWLGDQPAEGEWERREMGPGAADLAPRYDDDYTTELPSELPGPPEPGGTFERVATEIMAYRAFPESVLHGLVARTPVEVGDTLRAKYRLFPGLWIVLASRVTEILDVSADGKHLRGFTYRTLVGHPIAGDETFAVEKDTASGAVRAWIRAGSYPATWLSRVLKPWGRRQQQAAGRAGVEHLERCS